MRKAKTQLAPVKKLSQKVAKLKNWIESIVQQYKESYSIEHHKGIITFNFQTNTTLSFTIVNDIICFSQANILIDSSEISFHHLRILIISYLQDINQFFVILTMFHIPHQIIDYQIYSHS